MRLFRQALCLHVSWWTGLFFCKILILSLSLSVLIGLSLSLPLSVPVSVSLCLLVFLCLLLSPFFLCSFVTAFIRPLLELDEPGELSCSKRPVRRFPCMIRNEMQVLCLPPLGQLDLHLRGLTLPQFTVGHKG